MWEEVVKSMFSRLEVNALKVRKKEVWNKIKKRYRVKTKIWNKMKKMGKQILKMRVGMKINDFILFGLPTGMLIKKCLICLNKMPNIWRQNA